MTLDLAKDAGATELCLRHAVDDDEHWATYGPGAVGVGWELALLGLAIHLGTGGPADEGGAFMASAEGRDFTRRSVAAWGAAHAEAGVDAAVADEAAARTREAYVPDVQDTRS